MATNPGKSVIKGFDVVAKNIIKFQNGFLRHTDDTMRQIKVILDKKITENISLTDHTQKDLRALGHPYASRHGSQGLSLHEPNYKIHKQSGKLLSSKFSGTEKAEVTGGKLKASAFVGLDSEKAPHAPSVIFGTSKMIPRPVLIGSRNEVAQEVYNLLKTNLKNTAFSF